MNYQTVLCSLCAGLFIMHFGIAQTDVIRIQNQVEEKRIHYTYSSSVKIGVSYYE